MLEDARIHAEAARRAPASPAPVTCFALRMLLETRPIESGGICCVRQSGNAQNQVFAGAFSAESGAAIDDTSMSTERRKRRGTLRFRGCAGGQFPP